MTAKMFMLDYEMSKPTVQELLTHYSAFHHIATVLHTAILEKLCSKNHDHQLSIWVKLGAEVAEQVFSYTPQDQGLRHIKTLLRKYVGWLEKCSEPLFWNYHYAANSGGCPFSSTGLLLLRLPHGGLLSWPSRDTSSVLSCNLITEYFFALWMGVTIVTLWLFSFEWWLFLCTCGLQVWGFLFNRYESF